MRTFVALVDRSALHARQVEIGSVFLTVQIIKYFSFSLKSYILNMASEVEEIMKRMQNQKGVVGTMVVNAEGAPIKSTLDNATTLQYAGLISQLANKARSVVRDLDPSDELTFVRVRSKKHELLIAPDKDFLLLVVQNPTD